MVEGKDEKRTRGCSDNRMLPEMPLHPTAPRCGAECGTKIHRCVLSSYESLCLESPITFLHGQTLDSHQEVRQMRPPLQSPLESPDFHSSS